jgi:thioesterase-3
LAILIFLGKRIKRSYGLWHLKILNIIMQKIFESEQTIRFSDCDPFNHLNNSRYLDYFINTREDHLLKYHNFSIYEVAMNEGMSWVVSQNQMAHLKPANLMEKVMIDSSLTRISESKLKVEMKMWDLTKSHIKAILWVTFSYYDLRINKAPKRNERFMKAFKPF